MGVFVDVCLVPFSLALVKATKIQSAGASTKRSLKLEDYDSANTNFNAMTARAAALNPFKGVEEPPALPLPTPKASPKASSTTQKKPAQKKSSKTDSLEALMMSMVDVEKKLKGLSAQASQEHLNAGKHVKY